MTLMHRALPFAVVVLLAALVSERAIAQASAPGTAGVYTCTTPDGRRLTSDRPILECNRVEQRVLNSDGSLRRIVPPSLTADERAEREAAERRAQAERSARQDAVRRDRNLMTRFPDEAAHHKAREAALDPVRLAIRSGEQRLLDLIAERKPLLDEAEFYKGRQLPARLKQQLDANEAAAEALRGSSSNQQAELARVNRLYDGELERLRRLWAGAAPGSLPALHDAAGAGSSSSARSAAP